METFILQYDSPAYNSVTYVNFADTYTSEVTMAMTREEKNKRNRDSIASAIHSRYARFKTQIIELWIRAKRDKMTFRQILDYRNQWIFGEQYNKLPQWAKYRLEGCFEFGVDLAYRQDLVFCYPHPQDNKITSARMICDMGFAQALADCGNDKLGAHYWKNEDGTYTHAFN